MSIKKLAVAAALILCSVSASASNFTAADQVYIAVAGHVGGSSGTFVSDVFLANLTNDEVDISVIYQPTGEGGGTGTEFKNFTFLRPQERKEYKDFFVTGLQLASGFGQLIFNGCLRGASCGPDTQDEDGVSPNFRTISVTSRIFLIPTGQLPATALTTGQAFPGTPWYNFVSSLQAGQNLDKVFITGIRQTGLPGTVGTYRSNIGAANASQYSSTDIVFSLYQETLTPTNKKAEAVRRLGPLGSQQYAFSALFPSAPNGENYFVVVEQRNNTPTADAPSTCTQGCPAFLSWVSLLDNGSGDATTLPPQYLIELPGPALVIIYPTATGEIGVRRSVRH